MNSNTCSQPQFNGGMSTGQFSRRRFHLGNQERRGSCGLWKISHRSYRELLLERERRLPEKGKREAGYD